MASDGCAASISNGDEAVKREVSECLRNIREILELRFFLFFKSSK